MLRGHVDPLPGAQSSYVDRLFSYIEMVGQPKLEMMQEMILATKYDGWYMNAFQLAAAANVLQHPVWSVYPHMVVTMLDPICIGSFCL